MPADRLWASVETAQIAVTSIVLPIVPASHLTSNFFQLMTVGVSPRDITQVFKVKLVAINKYLANEQLVQ